MGEVNSVCMDVTGWKVSQLCVIADTNHYHSFNPINEVTLTSPKSHCMMMMMIAVHRIPNKCCIDRRRRHRYHTKNTKRQLLTTIKQLGDDGNHE